jgi:hypothetical protein
MKNAVTFSSISVDEQMTIMGGLLDVEANKKPTPNKKPTTKQPETIKNNGQHVVVGDHNTITIKILCW